MGELPGLYYMAVLWCCCTFKKKERDPSSCPRRSAQCPLDSGVCLLLSQSVWCVVWYDSYKEKSLQSSSEVCEEISCNTHCLVDQRELLWWQTEKIWNAKQTTVRYHITLTWIAFSTAKPQQMSEEFGETGIHARCCGDEKWPWHRADSQEVKHRISIWSSNSTSGCISPKNRSSDSKQVFDINVHRSIIHNGQNERKKPHVHQQMNEWTGCSMYMYVYTHTHIYVWQ